LPDYEQTSIALSLSLLEALHAKWTIVLSNMQPKDFERTYLHPENNRVYALAEALALYAWHCGHHYAHINLIA